MPNKQDFWIRFFATCGLGYHLPWEFPGIYGAFVGLGLAVLLNPLPLIIKLAISIILTIIGIPLCTRAEKILNHGIDPPQIAFDEVVGIQFASIWFNLFNTVNIFHFNVPLWLILILIFGIFDALEPFPIKRIEKLFGGWGIVLDDLMAGAYTILIIKFLILQFLI